MTAAGFELGLDSFGEVATDAGRVLSDTQTVPLIVAESVGLDVFGVGEHDRLTSTTRCHRCCWPRSQPPPSASDSGRR